jgi:hypothetical protein
MQTFLPFHDFKKTAKVLDRLRLGKQRVECLQIFNTILNNKKGWANHPAVSMWRGYEGALWDYSSIIIDEWTSRGYKDTCAGKILNLSQDKFKEFPGLNSHDVPKYMDEKFHSTHRAALLFKNLPWYGQFGWTETPQINYWWPTQELIIEPN